MSEIEKDSSVRLASESRMKRFAVFGGDVHYGVGGFHDYGKSFETLEEAKEYATGQIALRFASRTTEPRYQWWHIFDLDLRVVVACGEETPYGADHSTPQIIP